MKYKVTDIFDIPKLQNLMDSLYFASGISSTITDIDANILVTSGWTKICTNYHQKNIHTQFLCKESVKFSFDNFSKEKSYMCYKCKNGLIHAAAPIVIENIHIATIFLGQFLFEKPDMEKFREKAKECGFEEEEYLKTVQDIPIYTKEKLDSIMDYFLMLAKLLGEMGLSNIKALESKKKVLKENEKRIKSIMENTPNVAIQSYDVDGKIMYCNKAFEGLFGWKKEEIIGKNRDVLDLSLEPREIKKITKDGREKICFNTTFPIQYSEGKKGFISMEIDVTEQKRIEKKMSNLDKLNLIGDMATNIAHEIRNPLTAVKGFLQILEKKPDCKHKECFHLMLKEMDMVDSIINEILFMAKNKVVDFEQKKINSIIKKLKPIIKAGAVVRNQEVKLELERTPYLLLDEKEIRQLILNLARNAIEVMPSGGRLVLKTFNVHNEVVLEIRDNGPGIPKDIIDKIGTPFFTTKENTAGLGLCVCYSIAERHKAKIEVKSSSNGTSFFVRFKA